MRALLLFALAPVGCLPADTPVAGPGTTTGEDGSSSSGGDDWTRAGEGTSASPLWPDLGPSMEACAIGAAICPPGYKCLPVDDDGSSGFRCAPIVEDPGVPGEPCYVTEDPMHGDSCGLNSICWNVDDSTGIGYCAALCGWCGPREECVGQGSFEVCLALCHPLIQDCPLGQACYPDGALFICAPDLSGDLGAAGDPCSAVYGCDRGNACVLPNLVPGCEGEYCCSTLCEVGDSSECLEGQECLALPLGNPRGGLEIGICGAW